MSESKINLCPCGSSRPEASCCGPVIAGAESVKTAEALMRSRYVAYVQGNAEYLLNSWHGKFRPPELDLKQSQIHWCELQILQTQGGQPGDRQGTVEFIARYEQDGQAGQVQELSRFEFVQGQWLYLDGDLKATEKPGRNSPCPCGSGKKYKRCCG